MARGRPRQFDTEQALEAALDVFWRRGYEGASVAALCEAMGINVPSLYAAFGDKEQLFAHAVDRYLQQYASYIRRALEQPTARQTAEALLQGAIDMVSESGKPNGCMIVHGALVTNPANETIRTLLAERRKAAEKLLCQRFLRAQQEGDLPAHANAAELASFLITVNWGNAVQSASGATRKQLEHTAKMAMQCWPE